MIDTHCHIIPKFEYNNPKETIHNAVKNGVNKMIVIGCDFEDIEQCFNLQKNFPDNVLVAIGLHPETVHIDTNVHEAWEKFQTIVENNLNNIFAIGECGLDFHYFSDEDAEVITKKQMVLFKKHLDLCKKIQKPVIIHTRDAWESTFQLFNEYDFQNVKMSNSSIQDLENSSFPIRDIKLTNGIVHSFTGGKYEAEICIKNNFKLGINGIVTFQNKSIDALRQAVKFAGKENIVLETDSPFLTPVPYRGQKNEPARIKDIAEFVEELFAS